MTRQAFLLAAALTVAYAGAATPGTEGAQLGASAELVNAQGNVVGDANFTESEGDDGPFVTVQVGLTPDAGLEPGEYGLHLHQVGACTPTFDAAGDHFNPADAQHGLLDPDGAHAGDLPNLVVAADGSTSYVVSTRLVTLSEGETSLLDGDGSAIIIHADADDYLSDPSGRSGDRIICGVLQGE